MMHKKMINEAMRIAGEKVTSDKTSSFSPVRDKGFFLKSTALM